MGLDRLNDAVVEEDRGSIQCTQDVSRLEPQFGGGHARLNRGDKNLCMGRKDAKTPRVILRNRLAGNKERGRSFSAGYGDGDVPIEALKVDPTDNIVPAGHRGVIHAQNAIAALKSRQCRGGSLGDVAYFGGLPDRSSLCVVDTPEDHHRKQEVHHHAGGDDHHALPDRL